MDFKTKKIGQLPVKYLALLFCLFPVTSSRNIDCNGKAFHCLNATHFSICVNFGLGVSITIDDFAFPCPQGTECHIENNHECEILQTTTPKEINELTTESLHMMEEFTTNSLLTTESSIFTTNNNIEVSNNKSLLDKNVTASTTENTIQRTGIRGYFTDDLVTREDVTMNTVVVVTLAHTTEPVTKKRIFAERDLTNVSYNKSMDINETLNKIQETYNKTNTLSNIDSEIYDTTNVSYNKSMVINETLNNIQETYNKTNSLSNIDSEIYTTTNVSYNKSMVINETLNNIQETYNKTNSLFNIDSEIYTTTNVSYNKSRDINETLNNIQEKYNKTNSLSNIDSDIYTTTNVSYNISMDINETLNNIQETYNKTNALSNIDSDIYTTSKTSEATQDINIKAQTEGKQNNYQNSTTDIVSYNSTHTTPQTQSVSLKEETLLETTVAFTFTEENKENIAYTAGVTTDIVTELSPSNVVEGRLSADASTKNSKMDEVTETINISGNNVVNGKSESIIPNLETVTDNAGDILPGTVINKSTKTENLTLNQGVDDVTIKVKITSNITRPPSKNVKQETTTKDLNGEEVNIDPSILSTNLIQVTRTTEKGIVIEEATHLSSAVTPISEEVTISPITEVSHLVTSDDTIELTTTKISLAIIENIDNFINKTTEIPSIYVNDVNVTSSVSISLDRNTKTTDNLIEKEVSNLQEDKVIFLTSTEKSYPNLQMESISSTMSPNYYAVSDTQSLSTNMKNSLSILETTKDNEKEKNDNYIIIQPTTKFNTTEKLYPRNETSTEKSYINLKVESSTSTILSNLDTITKTLYLSNNEKNNIPEITDKDPILSSNDQNILTESIIDLDSVTEKQLININKQNISSKLHTTSAFTTIAETPNVQEEKGLTPTTEKYYVISQTSSDLNNNVDMNDVKTTNAYLRTNGLKYFSSGHSVTALSNIATPTLVTKLIAPPTKDIQITTESYKFIVNNKSYENVSTALPTNPVTQERSPESNYNPTIENYNIRKHVIRTSEGTPSFKLQSTTSPDNQKNIFSSSTKFSQSTVLPSINEVSKPHLQKSSKVNFVTEKTYIDGGDRRKVFTSTPSYTIKSNTNNSEINSFYKENIGSNINPTISNTTQGYVNIISESENKHSNNNHSHIVNSSTAMALEKHNITENGLVQKTIVDKQDDTVTRASTENKLKAVTVSTNYITLPEDMRPGQIQYSNRMKKSTPNSLTHNEIQGETNNTEQNQQSIVTNNNQAAVGSFNCSKRGKFGDSTDCRKFYICIGLPIPVVHYCPNNTVFSKKSKQCTKNISHCVRNNEFRCTQEGRFRDYLISNVYYLCVMKQHNHFSRYKLQCREGFHLDKDDVKCIQKKKSISISQSSNVEDMSKMESSLDSKVKSKMESSLDFKVKSKSSNSKGNKDFHCEKEGKFPHPTNCKKYYKCEKKKSGLRKKKKRCDSHEIFNKEKSKCVSSDSYECDD